MNPQGSADHSLGNAALLNASPRGAQLRMEQKSQSKFLPWLGFEPRTSYLAVKHANLAYHLRIQTQIQFQ